MDSSLDTDTISKILCWRLSLVTLSNHQVSLEMLLCKQQHGFCELSEALILRLLQLEERVAKLESGELLKQDVSHQITKKLLAESEERLRRLQKLLEIDFDSIHSHEANDANATADESLAKLKFGASQAEKDLDLSIQVVQSEDNKGQVVKVEDGIGEANLFDIKYLNDAQIDLLSA